MERLDAEPDPAPSCALVTCGVPLEARPCENRPCQESPRDQRQRTLIRALVYGDRLTPQDVLVRNVSAHGLGLTAREIVPRPGEVVIVQLPTGQELLGEVRWAHDKHFGVAIDDAIDVLELGLITHRRNVDFGRSIGWLVDQRLRIEPPPVPPSRLRPV